MFDELGVSLAGGHSAEGVELSVGFAAFAGGGERLLAKGGLQVGDRLILTKPIGTGVILAGAMRGKTAGPNLIEVMDAMDVSSAAAARTVAEHGATNGSSPRWLRHQVLFPAPRRAETRSAFNGWPAEDLVASMIGPLRPRHDDTDVGEKWLDLGVQIPVVQLLSDVWDDVRDSSWRTHLPNPVPAGTETIGNRKPIVLAGY